jgi:hypothetical protein
MKLSVAAAGLMASLIASQLSAQEAYNRVFLCDGDGVKMEIYIPESASRDFALKDGRPVLAWYALDLSDPDPKKGKSLEAVLVRYAEDKRALVQPWSSVDRNPDGRRRGELRQPFWKRCQMRPIRRTVGR